MRLPLIGILKFSGLWRAVVTVVQVAFIVENTRIGQLLDVVLLIDLCSSYIAIVPCCKRLVEFDAVVLDA